MYALHREIRSAKKDKKTSTQNIYANKIKRKKKIEKEAKEAKEKKKKNTATTATTIKSSENNFPFTTLL